MARTIERCLNKDLRRKLQAIGEVRLMLTRFGVGAGSSLARELAAAEGHAVSLNGVSHPANQYKFD